MNLATSIKLADWIRANQTEVLSITRTKAAKRATDELGVPVTVSVITKLESSLGWTRQRGRPFCDLQVTRAELMAIFAQLPTAALTDAANIVFEIEE
jgi:hypothetical protein